MSAFSIVVDLTQAALSARELAEHLRQLRAAVGENCRIWALGTAPMTTLVPGGAVEIVDATSPAGALNAIIRSAAADALPMVVLIGPVVPDAAALAALIESLSDDPMMGCAQPRFSSSETDLVFPLPSMADDRPFLTRAALARLPRRYVTTEYLSACFVLRRELIGGSSLPAVSHGSVRGVLRHLLGIGRRRGFRTLVDNSVVVSIDGGSKYAYPELPGDDASRLARAYPDAVTADGWLSALPAHRLERLMTAAWPSEVTRHLLVDCRVIGPKHNGTAHATLGLLDGLARDRGDWRVDVWASAEAIRFHALERRYPELNVAPRAPERSYAAAVCMSQPRSMGDIRELHERALVVAFNMLDTIAWDVVYTCRADVDKSWRFLARHADVIFYNSEFSRRRFGRRFPVSGATEVVTHHSLHAEEYAAAPRGSAGTDDILIMGNELDHKDVAATAELLADGFPYEHFLAIGIADAPRANVRAVPSGAIPEGEFESHIAGAKIMVFPSYYEGFGLPVVRALAHGCTVVVRESPLWYEIAGNTRLPGSLVTFDSPHGLIEAVGSVLHGDGRARVLGQGSLLGGAEPVRWRDCARRMRTALERALDEADCSRWMARDDALAFENG